MTRLVSIALLGAISISTLLGCGDARRLTVSSQNNPLIPGIGVLGDWEESPCGYGSPNVIPIVDHALDGSDHYKACFVGSPSGEGVSVHVTGTSSFSDKICVYPIDDDGQTATPLVSPINPLDYAKVCSLISSGSNIFTFDIDLGDQSQTFNSIAIVPDIYQFQFQDWVAGINPFEPPYSYGPLN